MSVEHRHPLRDMLPWYVNGTLSAAETAEVAAHLLSCQECQVEVAQWRQLAQTVHAQPLIAADTPAASDATRVAIHRALIPHAAPMKGPIMQPNIPPASRLPERRSSLQALIIVVLLSLFVSGGFVLFRSHGQGRTTTSGVAASPICHTKTVISGNNTSSTFAHVGQSMTVHGVTVTLNDFYADLTRILIVLTTDTAPASASQTSGYFPTTLKLSLATNQVIGSYGLPSGIDSANSYEYHSSALLLSVPLSVLSGPQSGTITIDHMEAGQGNSSLDGPWHLPITFTAAQPHSVSDLTCSPSVISGFSISPTSVAVSPAKEQLDGYPGGVILTTCLAAPKPTAPFHIYYADKSGAGVGTPESDPTHFAEALLTLPGGRQIFPQEDLDIGTCHIGSQQGKVHTFIYLTSLPTSAGHFVFTVPFLLYDNGTSLEPVTGPWHYEFDMQ